ncbi:UTRA domain-containing protein [Streptomyces bambusae]|nr:UTRA domain-containing protein [Streptomyces bambusae]
MSVTSSTRAPWTAALPRHTGSPSASRRRTSKLERSHCAGKSPSDSRGGRLSYSGKKAGRYGSVLAPGGERGPWETAAAAAGSVLPIAVEQVSAEAAVAALLGVEQGMPVVRRVRHALIDGDVVQVQEAFYPLDVASSCGLEGPGKVVGGVLAAMTKNGLAPRTVDEKVTTRMASESELEAFGVGERVPVLCVERVVRDAGGRVLEVLRVVGVGDRIELHYDALPLPRRTP